MFRQDLETVLFVLSALEVLRPFSGPSSPTILHTIKAELVTSTGQFSLPCPGGSPYRESDRGGGGGFPTLLGPVFRSFCPL